MSTSRKKIASIVIFFAAMSLCANIFAQQVLDRIVAIVDDDIILDSEVVQGAYLAAMQIGIDPSKSPREFEGLKRSTLDNLINQKILLIQADKDTILAEERQVDTYLQQQMQSVTQQLGGEDKVEEYFGMSITKIRRNYREEIEKNLRSMAVRNQKMAGIKVSRREVEEFFRTMKDSVARIDETVDISHILISAKAGDAARRHAIEQCKSIRERILAGEDFEQLAKEYSEDPGSNTRGGDLGFMSRGDFVREFEEAAFNLQQGELSDIVESQFGFHIIKLEERRGEKIHTRHILISIKPTQEDEAAAADTVKSLYRKLKNGADFNEMVDRYSEDESTQKMQGHLGEFEIKQLRERFTEFVFALDGVNEGDYAEPVQTQYGFHILKVNTRQAARELSLDKDWERIQNATMEYKIRKEFEKWIDEIKKTVYIEVKGLSSES